MDYRLKHFSSLIFLAIISVSCSGIFPDFESPYVKEHYPLHGDTLIPITASIRIDFSETMDKESAESSFSVSASVGTAGKYVWESPSCMTYQFEKALRPGTRYSVQLSGEARDKAGNRMGKEVLFAFYAGKPDMFPSVVGTYPEDMDERIPSGTNIVVRFSRSMDVHSVQAGFRIQPEMAGEFFWEEDNTCMRFCPLFEFEKGKKYSVIIGNESADTNGMKIAEDFSFSFFTGEYFKAPQVLGIYRFGDTRMPVDARYWTNNQEGIEKSSSVVVHFDEPMDRKKVERAFLTTPSKNGWFEWYVTEGEAMVFHPLTHFETESLVQIEIGSSAANMEGINLKEDVSLKVKMDGPFSRYLQCTQASVGGTILSFSDLNVVSIGSEHTNMFILKFNLADGNGLDTVAFQDSINIVRFAGSGDTGYSGTVKDIQYDSDIKSALISADDLSTNNYYRISLRSGNTGVRDNYGNPMKTDCIILFKTVR